MIFIGMKATSGYRGRSFFTECIIGLIRKISKTVGGVFKQQGSRPVRVHFARSAEVRESRLSSIERAAMHGTPKQREISKQLDAVRKMIISYKKKNLTIPEDLVRRENQLAEDLGFQQAPSSR